MLSHTGCECCSGNTIPVCRQVALAAGKPRNHFMMYMAFSGGQKSPIPETPHPAYGVGVVPDKTSTSLSTVLVDKSGALS